MPNGCFTKQLPMPASEIFQLFQIFFNLSEMQTQKMNTQEPKQRKFKEKVREKESAVLTFA